MGILFPEEPCCCKAGSSSTLSLAPLHSERERERERERKRQREAQREIYIHTQRETCTGVLVGAFASSSLVTTSAGAAFATATQSSTVSSREATGSKAQTVPHCAAWAAGSASPLSEQPYEKTNTHILHRISHTDGRHSSEWGGAAAEEEREREAE